MHRSQSQALSVTLTQTTRRPPNSPLTLNSGVFSDIVFCKIVVRTSEGETCHLRKLDISSRQLAEKCFKQKPSTPMSGPPGHPSCFLLQSKPDPDLFNLVGVGYAAYGVVKLFRDVGTHECDLWFPFFFSWKFPDSHKTAVICRPKNVLKLQF